MYFILCQVKVKMKVEVKVKVKFKAKFKTKAKVYVLQFGSWFRTRISEIAAAGAGSHPALGLGVECTYYISSVYCQQHQHQP